MGDSPAPAAFSKNGPAHPAAPAHGREALTGGERVHAGLRLKGKPRMPPRIRASVTATPSGVVDGDVSGSMPLLGEPTVARALGMIMALTPCSARDACTVLATAAASAHATVAETASAMVAAPEGRPMPVHVERALRRAVESARDPVSPMEAGAAPTAMLANRDRTAEVLARFRACQARLAAEPGNEKARREMDDVTYTLCVLMGRLRAHEAVLAAQDRLDRSP